jgi:hypothetical protein
MGSGGLLQQARLRQNGQASGNAFAAAGAALKAGPIHRLYHSGAALPTVRILQGIGQTVRLLMRRRAGTLPAVPLPNSPQVLSWAQMPDIGW